MCKSKTLCIALGEQKFDNKYLLKIIPESIHSDIDVYITKLLWLKHTKL